MNLIKKFFKAFALFIASSLILYLVFTISAFVDWCNENQISIINPSDDLFVHLDSDKIQEIGNQISTFSQVMEDSLDPSYYEENSNYHSLAEFYDPLGFSVWAYMEKGITGIISQYFTISILLGFSIAIAYVVITSKKLHPILKFVIGYFGIMLVIPPIYMYSYTYRFWSISETFHSTPNYFFILYTILFFSMYLINYWIGIRMTKDLNKTIKNT